MCEKVSNAFSHPFESQEMSKISASVEMGNVFIRSTNLGDSFPFYVIPFVKQERIRTVRAEMENIYEIRNAEVVDNSVARPENIPGTTKKKKKKRICLMAISM